jgi:opacity protein-like surface antigen
MTLAAYGAYIYNVNSEFYIKPRAGFIYKHASVDVTAKVDEYAQTWSGSGSDSEFGISFGVGAGFNVSKELAVYADWTMIDTTDINHLTVGVTYKF